MGAVTYVTHAINNLKKRMAAEGFKYNKKLSNVNYSPQKQFSNIHYCREMDVTDECSNSHIQLFRSIIVIM